jgi:hypothetical protein
VQAEWVFPDVLAKGRGHALYAAHKEGKSLFMLYMAATMATGPEPIVVVYCDYEMTEADVLERLEDMGYGPESDLSRLRYALLPDLVLDTPDGGSDLVALVDGVQAQYPDHHVVVAVDTISRAVAGKENDADTYRAFYTHTGIHLKQRGVTWVRLDHAGKQAKQGQRGSSSKGDDVDVVWKLTKSALGRMTLHRDFARMAWVPSEVRFNMDEDPLRYLPVEQAWPDGTDEVVADLAMLHVPLDASVKTCREALRRDNRGRSNVVIAAAVRWRKQSVTPSVTPSARCR